MASTTMIWTSAWPVNVSGHDGQVLSFDHYYGIELGWDFGFVQVSTDNGESWQSLACSRHDHEP